MIISKNSSDYLGMKITYFSLNEKNYNDINELHAEVRLAYKISVSALKRIIKHHEIPFSVHRKYPDLEYVDNVDHIPTTIGEKGEDDLDIIPSDDKIDIKVFRYINPTSCKVVRTTYKYNDLYCNLRELRAALRRYGLIWRDTDQLVETCDSLWISDLLPNLTITEERIKQHNASDIKYAIDCESVSKRGHKTRVVMKEGVEHDFQDSDDRFDIVREDNYNYSLNGEMIGSAEQLLSRLNEMKVDITKNQFRMIIGHVKVPQSLLNKYPNMTYTSKI